MFSYTGFRKNSLSGSRTVGWYRQTDGQTDTGTERVQQELCREDKARTLTAVTTLNTHAESFTKAAKPYKKSLRSP